MNSHTPSARSSRLPRAFHMVVKPVGSLCNLNCTYCYYLHKEDLLGHSTAGPMADDLLEEFIRQYIAAQDVDRVLFNWHGGEPALLGLDFFRKVVELERKYAGAKRIENDFQTNGVLLDESWCEFLKEHGFHVGLSIDGPKHLHERFRVRGPDKTGTGTLAEPTHSALSGEIQEPVPVLSGEPTFDQVYRAARLLQRYEVPFNTLTVVNSVNARHPEEVYRFLTEDLGCRRLQWLPCVEPKDFRTTAPGRWDIARMPMLGTAGAKPGHPTSVVTDWSVDPDDWGDFLCQTFYLWLKNGLGHVLINWFESLVGQWMGQPPQLCTLAEVCGRSLVTIDRDGSLYSCDRFVYPEYRLENLRDEDCQLADVVYSPQQHRFGANKRDSLPNYCKRCSYRFACNGECPKNRFIRTPDGQPGLNYLCSGIRRFLTYADPYLRQIVAQLHGSVTVTTEDAGVRP